MAAIPDNGIENTILIIHADLYAVAERTQQIVWHLPAEPRFRVTQGGLRRDGKAARQVVSGLGMVGFFILLLVFWPHHAPSPVPAQNLRGNPRPDLFPTPAFSTSVARDYSAALPLNTALPAQRVIPPAAPTASRAPLMPNPY